MYIRFANLEDLPSINQIYNQAILSGKATADLEQKDIKERHLWFSQFDERTYPIYVYADNDQILGYCYLTPYRPKREALKHVAELSYYVDYEHHNKGIGTSLMDHVIKDCKRIQIHVLLAFVLGVNIKTIGILEKYNFTQWGTLEGVALLKSGPCDHVIYGAHLE